MIQIITSSAPTEPDDTSTDTEGWKTVTVSAGKEVVGFHAVVDVSPLFHSIFPHQSPLNPPLPRPNTRD